MDTDDRGSARARFIAFIRRAPAGAADPDLFCQACLAAPPVQRVGITNSPGGGHEFLCASDEIAERLEFAQIPLGDGPRITAFDNGGPVASLDDADNRW